MKLNKLVKKSTQAEQKSKKQKPNSTFVDFDMLYLLSYMSVIAGADVPRDRVFEYTSRISCAPARYLHRIELAHTQLGHDYATACRVVGESAKEKGMKQFLLRFTSSLISGESEATFLAGEAEAQTRAYENDYVRKMGVLKQWTDAYISLILAGVLVVIVGIVSTMIWTIGTAFILGLVAISVGTSTLGVWTMSVMVPRELVTLASPGSREQKLTRILLVVLVPLAVGVSALLFLLGAGSGWVMLAGGVLILPIGLVSNLDHKKITSRDTEVGAFLRSLGGVCTALGTTVKDGLGQLDLGAVNVLRPGVKRLHTRLLAGIRPGLCWQRFISETGSELSNRSVGMFYDAVDLGGDPEQAGDPVSIPAPGMSDAVPVPGCRSHDLYPLIVKYHEHGPDVVCDIGQEQDDALDIVRMWQALHPIYQRVQDSGGLPLHGALVERNGAGVLLAGPGDTGKSTCCRRIPAPWLTICDDEALIVRDEQARYVAHGFPTWSDYIWGRSERTWNVQRHFPLAGIFFLEQGESDRVEPLGRGKAAALINESAMQVCRRGWRRMDLDTKRPMAEQLFANACELAGRVPAFSLSVSMSGRFWDEMERVLARDI